MLPTRMLHGECSVLADPTPIPRVSPILVIGTNVKYQNPEYSAQAQCQGLLSEGNISFRWGTYVVPSDAYGRLDSYPLRETAGQKQVPKRDHFWVDLVEV
jgi:hypothetical protein